MKDSTLNPWKQGSSVPKFGNWDNEDDVPYTVYFDKARKNRGGKMINPNDPQENPEMFPSKAPSAPTSKPRVQSEEPTGYGAVKVTDKRPVSKEDGDLNQQYASSPARNNDNMEKRRRASESAARPARQSAGSDRSFDKSPLHPVHQVKASAGRGSGSPAREGKYSYDSSSHGTPGRSYDSSQGGGAGRTRPKPESPDRGAAVPKFGEWDEKNPQSADNYTYIFNKVRDERHAESTNPSATPTRPSTTRDQQDEKFQKRCCPWW